MEFSSNPFAGAYEQGAKAEEGQDRCDEDGVGHGSLRFGWIQCLSVERNG